MLTLINFNPNKNENVNEFRRQLVMDFLLTGNAYQAFDKELNSLFHLPYRHKTQFSFAVPGLRSEPAHLLSTGPA